MIQRKDIRGDYFITSYKGRILSALCQDDQLVQASFCMEKSMETSTTDEFHRLQTGTILIGKVLNIVKNIQAAFVEICPGVNGYLPYDNMVTPMPKQGDLILVQIIKDAVKTKDAVLSMDISLSGKYIAINAQYHKLLFSKKASLKQVDRLKRLLEESEILKDYPYGVILRTNAILLSEVTPLLQELQILRQNMEHILTYASARTAYSVMSRPMPTYIEKLRDTYGLDYQRIMTDDPLLYEELKEYLEVYAPKERDKLEFFQKKSMSLVNFYKLGEKIERALSTQVWLKCGGYLVIEPTESLTAIDVNTGKYVGKGDKEDTIFCVNLEAAKEIARQLRIRNISGMILVDFINMKEEAHNIEIMNVLRKLTANDPVQTSVIDMTALGLVEITRKKINKTLMEQYNETITAK